MNKFLFLAGSLLIASASASPKYLTYEQFGAKGDGVTNDFPAIMATHETERRITLATRPGRP